MQDNSGMTKELQDEILKYLKEEMKGLVKDSEDLHIKTYFLCTIMGASGIKYDEETILSFISQLDLDKGLFIQYASVFKGMKVIDIPDSIGEFSTENDFTKAGLLSKESCDDSYVRIAHEVSSLHLNFIGV
jgi:hypothetical protein